MTRASYARSGRTLAAGRKIRQPGTMKQKYEECAGGVLSQSQVDESLAMIETLDSLPKVKDLMAVLQA